MKSSKVEWTEVGIYLQNVDERNSDNKFGLEDVRGLSIDKKFIPTKANMEGVSLKPYKLVKPGSFCYVTVTSRNSEKITLAYNDSDDTYLVSSSYEVFRITDTSKLLPEFLYLWFVRPEFNRYSRFHSWGSARETFSYEEIKRVRIPLPSIEEQRAVVDAWKSLRKIKEENEAIAAPLLQLCQSYIQECKYKYPIKPLKPYIVECNERNRVRHLTEVRGMSTEKEFRIPQSRVDFEKLDNYKIVYKNHFVFVPTTDTWRCLAICVSREDVPFVVSPIYCVFKVNESIISPDYLHLYFKRKELDRYARFHSWGSARENFNFEDMQRLAIPLPPIDVQRAIASLYNCALEYKAIATKADAESKAICPALMQHVINN